MTKSTAIVFVLFFSILFRLERKVGLNCFALLICLLRFQTSHLLFLCICVQRSSLIAIVALIALGLFLFTFRSTSFQLNGFLLVMLASGTSGLRWTLAQLLSQASPRNLNTARQTSSAASTRTPSRTSSPSAPERIASDSADEISQHTRTLSRPEPGAPASSQQKQQQQQHVHGLLSNPIDLMYHVEPFMILALLPLCLAFEGRTHLLSGMESRI